MEKLFFGEAKDKVMKRDWGNLEHGILYNRKKRLIGVVGVGKGAGATFIAINLAFKLAELVEGVTFAEGQKESVDCVKPYHILAVDKQFNQRRFIDFFKEDEAGCNVSSRMNLYKKVNWAVRLPDNYKQSSKLGCDRQQSHSPDDEHQHKEIDYRRLAGKYIIVDNPFNAEDMDLLIGVVDPLPARILSGIDIYDKLKQFDIPKTIWLLNKNNNHVNRRDVENFLKVKFDLEMELIPETILYKAQYNCTQPFFLLNMSGIERLAKRVVSEV